MSNIEMFATTYGFHTGWLFRCRPVVDISNRNPILIGTDTNRQWNSSSSSSSGDDKNGGIIAFMDVYASTRFLMIVLRQISKIDSIIAVSCISMLSERFFIGLVPNPGAILSTFKKPERKIYVSNKAMLQVSWFKFLFLSLLELQYLWCYFH